MRNMEESECGLDMATAMLEQAAEKGSHEEHGIQIEHRRFTKMDKSDISNRLPNDVNVDRSEFIITITYKNGIKHTIVRDVDTPLSDYASGLARNLRDRGLVPGFEPYAIQESDRWRPDLTKGGVPVHDVEYDNQQEGA